MYYGFKFVTMSKDLRIYTVKRLRVRWRAARKVLAAQFYLVCSEGG